MTNNNNELKNFNVIQKPQLRVVSIINLLIVFCLNWWLLQKFTRIGF